LQPITPKNNKFRSEGYTNNESGAFENDPGDIASYFALHLIEGQFKNRFDRVVFAIKSKEERFISPFKRLFSK
jgi:hypothetical protein